MCVCKCFENVHPPRFFPPGTYDQCGFSSAIQNNNFLGQNYKPCVISPPPPPNEIQIFFQFLSYNQKNI